ncbi:hypothetical protein JGK47_000608 [Vibrio metoecus]
MSNNELIAFIKKCSIDSANLPIRIENKQVLQSSLSLFINRTKKQLEITLFFIEEETNELFESLNSDNIIRNINEFLNQKDTKIAIISNRSKLIKSSYFYKNIPNKKPKVHSIPEKLEARINNYSYIISDNIGIIVGRFNYSETVDEKQSFVNFNDEKAASIMSTNFSKLVDLSLSGAQM